MTLGERLRSARTARSPRVTLAELAGDRLSISLISKIERGLVQPSLATLAYLADRLDLPLSDLVGGDAGAAELERALAVERARAALVADEPAAALRLVEELDGVEATLVRARALLALRRDDEAGALLDSLQRHHGAATLPPGQARPPGAATLAPGQPDLRPGQSARPRVRAALPPGPDAALRAEAALLRGEALARSGARDLAQDAYGRALALAPSGQATLRAEALSGLAWLAEGAGEPATARNLYQQAVAELGSAASPTRRQAALAGRAAELSDSGDALGALRAAAAAAAVGALARASALRAELLSHLPDVGRPPPAPTAPVTRFREAEDSMRHRSIRPPPEA